MFNKELDWNDIVTNREGSYNYDSLINSINLFHQPFSIDPITQQIFNESINTKFLDNRVVCLKVSEQ